MCERVIGTIRRECLDWVIPLSEPHLRSILHEWVSHYNGGHPHSALGPGVPGPPRGSARRPKAEARHRWMPGVCKRSASPPAALIALSRSLSITCRCSPHRAPSGAARRAQEAGSRSRPPHRAGTGRTVSLRSASRVPVTSRPRPARFRWCSGFAAMRSARPGRLTRGIGESSMRLSAGFPPSHRAHRCRDEILHRGQRCDSNASAIASPSTVAEAVPGRFRRAAGPDVCRAREARRRRCQSSSGGAGRSDG
ncbi:MAG: hypothetical protein EOP82_24045 [Variovorax sp.]|nr:MAG: hypothetical protein EOP82_24045 [Variovorax sp.]